MSKRKKRRAEMPGSRADNCVVVTTPSGNTYRIDREALDDWTFVDLASNVQDDGGSNASTVAMVRYFLANILSPEDASKVERAATSPSGRVLSSKVIAEALAILTGISQGNS